MTPSTSVIIPCYNGEKYLYRALESVRAQSVPVYEIIIVDDGSAIPIAAPEDWTGPRLEIIHTSNRGLAAARNTALARATGEFVAFLDSDDEWLPNKIEMQLALMRAEPSASACYTRCVREEGFFGFGPYPGADVMMDEFAAVLWHVSFFPPSAVMVRKSALDAVGPFRDDLGNGEDIEMWFRLLSVGPIVQVAEPLTLYRVHANQFTTNVYKKIAGGKNARKAILALHTERLLTAGLPKSHLWEAYRRDVLLVFYRRQFTAARPLLWDYWRDHPADAKVLLYALVSRLPARWVERMRGRAVNANEEGWADPSAIPDGWEKLKATLPVNWPARAR